MVAPEHPRRILRVRAGQADALKWARAGGMSRPKARAVPAGLLPGDAQRFRLRRYRGSWPRHDRCPAARTMGPVALKGVLAVPARLRRRRDRGSGGLRFWRLLRLGFRPNPLLELLHGLP